MMPSLSVVHTDPSCWRNEAPALSSPPNATEPSSSPGTNHLKPTGTSSNVRPSPSATLSIIDELTSVLPTAVSAGHAVRCAIEVLDGHGEVVVRIHQAAVGRDDAVPVGVCVVACRDVEVTLPRDQRGHCVRRRAVHPDLAVPVEGHEPECRVDVGVHDGQLEAVAHPISPQ